jgi:hypothetical protein
MRRAPELQEKRFWREVAETTEQEVKGATDNLTVSVRIAPLEQPCPTTHRRSAGVACEKIQYILAGHYLHIRRIDQETPNILFHPFSSRHA